MADKCIKTDFDTTFFLKLYIAIKLLLHLQNLIFITI